MPLVAILTDLAQIDPTWASHDLAPVYGFGVIEIAAAPESADAAFQLAFAPAPGGTDLPPPGNVEWCPMYINCKAARRQAINACKAIADSAMLSCPIAAQQCLALCLPLIPINPAAFAACAANCVGMEISCIHGVIQDFRACLIQVEVQYSYCMADDPHNHPLPASSVFPPLP